MGSSRPDRSQFSAVCVAPPEAPRPKRQAWWIAASAVRNVYVKATDAAAEGAETVNRPLLRT
jgi:hypothetical protein